MIILGSVGFHDTMNRLKIGELLPHQNGTMLIIPFARTFEAEAAKKEKNGAAMLDFKEEKIFVFDRAKAEELMSRDYDYIVVLGGNTFKLLHEVREYHLDSFIKAQAANGAVYLGFSAGACLACPDVGYVQDFDENPYITDGNYTALGLMEQYVLCHSDIRDPGDIQKCRAYLGDGPELMTIKEHELVVLA